MEMLDIEVFEGGFKETELGLLPEEWEVVRLGEVGNYINGYAFKPSDWGKTGKPIIRIQNLNNPLASFNYYNGELDHKYLVKKGDILISWSASLGVYLWNGEDAWLNQHIFKVELTNQKVLKDYFYFALLYYFTSQAFTNLHGSTMKHIVKSKFLNISIPLPPLEEQKAIAGILSTVQSAIEKTEKVINALKNLKKSMMKHLFTYGPVAEEEAEKVELKETEIGLIPKHWEVVRLGEVVEKMKAGGTPRRSEKRFWGGSIPFIMIEDLTKSNLYIKDAREYITEEGLKNSNAWIVPPNSLLLSIYATIGETAINLIPVATNQAILGIIPKKHRLNVEFGAYLLKFHAKRLLFQNIQTTQKNINKGIVENFLIPLPPLEEQKAIAGVLSTVQSAIEKTEKVINALKNLKKSMMKHLFTYGPVAEEEAEKVELKETEIGLIPKHWEVVRLGEVYNITKKPKGLRIENYDAVPFVPMEGIGFGAFSVNFIIKDPEEISSGTYFEKGDLLLAKITPSFENGKQAIANNIPIDFGIATTEVIPIKQTEKGLISYLFYYLQKPDVRQSLASKMEGTTGRQRLPKEALLNALIPLPPLEEQQKIAQILQSIDQRIEKEEKYKNALQNLFKSLLHNLMTGKIRVRVKNHG